MTFKPASNYDAVVYQREASRLMKEARPGIVMLAYALRGLTDLYREKVKDLPHERLYDYLQRLIRGFDEMERLVAAGVRDEMEDIYEHQELERQELHRQLNDLHTTMKDPSDVHSKPR